MSSAAPIVYLHIGAMKTGTTFLQMTLRTNQSALRDEGVFYPAVKGKAVQIAAARDVLHLDKWDERASQIPGAWKRLVDEIQGSEAPTSVISMEFLSFASPDKAQQIVASLQPAEVHVVLTVRDIVRVLPAQWQNSVRNGGQDAWPDFCGALLTKGRSDRATRRRAMRALAVPKFLERWAPTVPADRLHVVVTPDRALGPDALWRRFASVIGVLPDAYVLPDRTVNPSLGYVSADLVRRLNRRLQDLDETTRSRLVSRLLGRWILPSHPGERPPPMTAEVVAFARELNSDIAASVRSHRAQVVGDLTELDGSPGDVAGSLDKPTGDELLDAAAWAVDGLSRWLDPPAADAVTELRRDTWSTADQPVASAVTAVESLLREVLARDRLGSIR
jgi:hypothetical protein